MLGLVLRVRFRVRVRISINIEYILYFIHVLHFIHLHSVGGTTVRRTGLAILCILCPVRGTGQFTEPGLVLTINKYGFALYNTINNAEHA